MKAFVSFSVDVDWCEEPNPMTPELKKRIEESVHEAVFRAIDYAQGHGHSHEMEDEISILMDSEITVKLEE